MAFALTLASLLYRAGTSPLEPMPYTGGVGNPNFPPGVVVCPVEVCRPNALSSRGWPLQIVAVTTDDYGSPSDLYHSVLVVSLLADLALYFVISFGLLTWWDRRSKKRSASHKRS
jgi:hypothetical protein